MIPQRHATSRIGLLGGSFNPAHQGHREISLAALNWLELDAVWWLVTPASPLKDTSDYAPYEERLRAARLVADHPAIVVSNFEQRRGLRYTVDTLAALGELWPQIRFVWLMGADSLSTFHQWKDWRKITTLFPFAVFNRPGAEQAGEESPAAQEVRPFRVDAARGGELADMEPPAWAFYPGTANPISSTSLRNRVR